MSNRINGLNTAHIALASHSSDWTFASSNPYQLTCNRCTKIFRSARGYPG